RSFRPHLLWQRCHGLRHHSPTLRGHQRWKWFFLSLTLGGASATRRRLRRERPRVCWALDPTRAVSKGLLKKVFARRCCDTATICSIPETDSFQSSDYCRSRTLLTRVLEYCRRHSSKTSAPWRTSHS